MSEKTMQPRGKDIQRKWHLIDAQGEILGRLSTKIAELLMGKNKVNFVRHLDLGDYVVVINAEKIVLTGNKEQNKLYHHHSGYPGGLRTTSVSKTRSEHPERLIVHSVSGMLPKNKLRDQRLTRLKVVIGSNNPFAGKNII